MKEEIEKYQNLLVEKRNWEKGALSNVCVIDPSRRELNGINDNSEVSFGMMADLGEHKRKFSPTQIKKIRELTKGGYSYFKENDVLLAKMTPCFENGKSGIALDLRNGIGFGSSEFYVLRSNEKVLPDFIYSIISSEKFLEEGKHSLVGTTGRRRLIKSYVESFEIPIPSLLEQKQITELFQRIDTIIDGAEKEEECLKSLQRKLVNGFVSDCPFFGNLLDGKTLRLVRYADVVEKLMRKIDAITYENLRIVAGENLESEDFKIRTWGIVGRDFLGPAFHVLFKPGDILYGSRRTYLKKISVADFEGVCSNTTYVIRSDESVLLQGLLKYVMLSDKFTQYSIGVSKGSTNPYINWKDLDNFSFQIPNLETQKEIILILDSILELIEQIKTKKQILKNLKQKFLNEILE